MPADIKISKQNNRRYQNTDLPKLLDGTIDVIDGPKMRKLLEIELQTYFVAQQSMIDELKAFERTARKEIEKEIAAGGTGKQAEITDLKGGKVKAHTFLKQSSMYTTTSIAESGGVDENGEAITNYRTTETAKFGFHRKFIDSWTTKGAKDGYDLGHQQMSNAAIAGEIYLSRLDPNDPRRPQIKAILAAMRLLDKEGDKLVVKTAEGSVDTLSSMQKIFTALGEMENIESVANYTRSVDLLKTGAHIDYDVAMQYGKQNKQMGKVSQQLKALMEQVLREGLQDVFDPEALLHVPGSKTFMRALKDQMIDLASGKSVKREKTTVKGKKRKKVKVGLSQANKKFKKQKRDMEKAIGALTSYTPRQRSGSASTNRAQGAGSGQDLGTFLALLNQKLPQTVVKNMGPPGLQNRTGRFASSVKVTDVSRTAQGHPSVGYTYQKNPYQIFEMRQGQAPWATPDRDPRKLIDASIREIAAQLAIGRFYTRRV
tara:strand:- start:329 stop:1786 length:1458 start_codon:yes stop_codon:yes gene_type:complete